MAKSIRVALGVLLLPWMAWMVAACSTTVVTEPQHVVNDSGTHSYDSGSYSYDSGSYVYDSGSYTYDGAAQTGDSGATDSASFDTAPTECITANQCASAPACQLVECVQGQCSTTNLASGTSDHSGSLGLVCQRAVCDGDGGYLTVPDPSAASDAQAPACQSNACDDAGNPTTVPDPNNLLAAPAPACLGNACDDAGNATTVPDPSNLPSQIQGDCLTATCLADGGLAEVPDDTDVPPGTTCATYTCSSGMAVSHPANPTASCSSFGFVCGADGTCATCPAPDAACDDPGPGSLSSATPYDFQGIGHCDDGGRDFCGAVTAGQAEYDTYYDNGTGPLCIFDPYFEIEPSAPVTLCVYFDCPSITCPVPSTPGTSANGQPGCCLAALPGGFTGMAINFCAGGRVTTKVTSASGCAGYQLHFHD